MYDICAVYVMYVVCDGMFLWGIAIDFGGGHVLWRYQILSGMPSWRYLGQHSVVTLTVIISTSSSQHRFIITSASALKH